MIKTIPVKFPDYDDEGVEVGETTMEVPLCHLTPMNLNHVSSPCKVVAFYRGIRRNRRAIRNKHRRIMPD